VSSRALDDPVAERRRLAALAHIRQLGDPALRATALPIEAFDRALRADAARMGAIMRDAAGVGLAAPQIGSLRRLVVLGSREDDRVTALCNPRIVWRSDEEEVADEGCLSLGAASVVVPVERPASLTVEASAPDGSGVRLEAEGLEARIIQHELDHLDGVLTIDRTGPDDRRRALADLRPQIVLG
jgi:peptide deformylase